MIFELLTHLQPFEIAAKMKTKVQNLTYLNINFNMELLTIEIFEFRCYNVPSTNHQLTSKPFMV